MLQGRVSVNGATVRELGTKADAARDDIRVDGRRVRPPERHRYILLNKPRGYMTTRSDPERRPTVLDLLREVEEYVYPVGRLDFASEGLLILTNDGDLAARLTHPRHGVARVYEARVLGVPDAHDLDRLARGVTIDGRRTAPAEVKLVSRHSSRRAGPHPRPRQDLGGGAPRAMKNTDDSPAAGADAHSLLEITVREGRNREVRKMCDAIGHPVRQLTRVAIGPIRDGRLKVGYWRDLTRDEVERLRKAAARTHAARANHKEHKGHKEETGSP